ncbi:major capsid protein [Mycobacterium tuberculosis]|uniref:major capsid protein n=1 Tax=Mycobacterium tuberculosis TaxID=1773 RepID=UPI003F760645
MFQGYLNIYNNYFKAQWMPDRTETIQNDRSQDDARDDFRGCHLNFFFFQQETAKRDGFCPGGRGGWYRGRPRRDRRHHPGHRRLRLRPAHRRRGHG